MNGGGWTDMGREELAKVFDDIEGEENWCEVCGTPIEPDEEMCEDCMEEEDAGEDAGGS